MSLYKQFATNKEAEQEGIWVEYGPNEDGTVPAFKIARAGKSNKKFVKAFEKATKPHRRAMEIGTMDNDIADKLMHGVFVSTVLLDWRNVQDKHGKAIQFTRDSALALLSDLPDLYDDLSEKASKASLYVEEALEEDAKN